MNTVKPIIEIKGIGKEYDITHQRGGYIALRDILAGILKNPFRFLKHKVKQVTGFEAKEAFWALKDVSFDVMPGEIIGIIGANGAGKSTLLKILTGITPPTEGEIIMRGRVASLLEVGTGFHPELTGRENVFLNGAILGMTKKEIAQKFDEIVAFSGVEKFLDTPVKYYSSGMYVRLAFSVAAHMEPDILLVDEVLAVGDAEFQKKCLGKMEEVTKKEGRTILFVSHNLSAIQRLCHKTVLLEKGKMVMFDKTDRVINFYLKSHSGISTQKIWSDRTKAPGDAVVHLREVFMHRENEDCSKTNNFDITKKIGISMNFEVLEDNHVFTCGADIFNEQGVHILSSHDVISPQRKNPRRRGKYTATMWIPANFLAEGTMLVAVAIFKPEPFTLHFYENDVVSFSVVDKIDGTSARGDYTGNFPGVVRPILQWETTGTLIGPVA